MVQTISDSATNLCHSPRAGRDAVEALRSAWCCLQVAVAAERVVGKVFVRGRPSSLGMWRTREALARPPSPRARVHGRPQCKTTLSRRRAACRTMRIHGSHGLSWIPAGLGFPLPNARLVRSGVLLRPVCSLARRPAVRARAPAAYLELCRGAKTTSTTKLKDLPQGALKLEPYDDRSDDVPRYPTVMQGHRNNVQRFKNCVVLTRVGGFYEV